MAEIRRKIKKDELTPKAYTDATREPAFFVISNALILNFGAILTILVYILGSIKLSIGT